MPPQQPVLPTAVSVRHLNDKGATAQPTFQQLFARDNITTWRARSGGMRKHVEQHIQTAAHKDFGIF